MDYLRGTNPVGVIFDEYSRMSPAVWDTMRPILRENEGFIQDKLVGIDGGDWGSRDVYAWAFSMERGNYFLKFV